ncbi:MAG TPA: nicotinamide riboside transporter PnuC [Bacillota bacterium]
MDVALKFFDVNTVAFTIIGYHMSYIEFLGTIFYLWSVWLIARRQMLTWPVGIISVILYLFLFYQIRLYSDALEQLYYLGASVYGWWYWKRDSGQVGQTSQEKICLSTPGLRLAWGAGTLVLAVLLSMVVSRLHLIVPAIFTEPASFPFLDALTTVMSFTAMFLMARKYLESWIYWIIVDLIGTGLYFVKGVKFLSLLYLILLGIAIKGWVDWRNCMKKQ